MRAEPARAKPEVEHMTRLAMRPVVRDDVLLPGVFVQALRVIDGKREKELVAAMRVCIADRAEQRIVRAPILAFHMRILDARLESCAFAEMPEVARRLVFILRGIFERLLRFLFPFLRARVVCMSLVEAFLALRDIVFSIAFVVFSVALVSAGIGLGILGVLPRVLELFEIRLRFVKRGFGVIECR